MKFYSALPYAALASALVVPPDETINQISIQENHRDALIEDDVRSTFEDWFKALRESGRQALGQLTEASSNALDNALEYANEAIDSVNEKLQETGFDAESWLDSSSEDIYDSLDDHDGHRPGHGRRPHHPPHHGKPNQTVYELISTSKYTTKLAELVNKYDDLVEALNSTDFNGTALVPTDKAFERIPEGAPEPSKEQLYDILTYHILKDFYPAKRVLVSHTAPTLLESDSLGTEPKPQRISFNVGLKGLTVNFFSRIVAVNIFGTNGVIHGLSSVLVPPPDTVTAISLFPGEFSTLELGLTKTGLLDTLNSTDGYGTVFAPSNNAWRALGPKINAFLFSPYGQKYLKALIEYHISPRQVLYSDAFYSADDVQQEGVPKGYFHVDLPTLLESRTLSVDIARYGGFIRISINGFNRVVVQDGIVKDGVIHVVGSVIVPPKSVGGPGDEQADYWDGESEMSVDELISRLEPFVAKEDL